MTRPENDNRKRETIELLAPAGNMDCLRAAVENGADAVYFGLDDGFNARARAANFAIDELDHVVEFLRGRCVKGYLALNTLIFSSELEQFERVVRRAATAGIDAVLVQDLGAARIIREVCPDLEIHASTQMTLTSAETIREIESLAISRVVLARELSIDEIQVIASQTTMPLEVFAHGALCVAYSGQCMTSESLGGRSANRGQCAQACRLAYDLICDGQKVDLGDQRYLLSPQDLAAYDLIPELIAAGISALKIEGRLKTPEYVANITSRYRQAIDLAICGERANFDSKTVEEMELSFSRGFSPGWLRGCDHKMLVPATSSAKRGIRLGAIDKIRGSVVRVRLDSDVKPGDGVVFDADRAREVEQGGRVYTVHRTTARHDRFEAAELSFAHGSIDFNRLYVGQTVWKTDDPALTKRLRRTFQEGRIGRRVAIDVTVVAEAGRPSEVQATTDAGVVVIARSETPLESANRHAATKDFLREQIDRLGNTRYQLRDFAAEINGAPMVPLSVIGSLRREIVSKLDTKLREVPNRNVTPGTVLPALRPPRNDTVSQTEVQLHVLCRTMVQLQIAIESGVRDLMADFQDIREYKSAVDVARESRANLLIATPRIQKPGEMGIFRKMASYDPDGVLVRNLSGIRFFVDEGIPAVADFSLNVANEITASYLRGMGIQRMTASYDLNRDQLLDLLRSAPADWFEVVIHQHMPMFHMEHCVFCSVLSPGTNKTNCGRPCDVHAVQLQDRIGMSHTLLADVGCRNTLFNAQPQSGAEVVGALLTTGIKHFRLELLDHKEAGEIKHILQLYSSLLVGDLTGREVWTRLKASNRVGVTRGTLEG